MYGEYNRALTFVNSRTKKKVLEDIGFTEQLQKNSVLELSGGWRMKLALAGAILSSADLLLLDEVLGSNYYIYIYI